MTWNQIYQDQGLKWELINSVPGNQAQKLYSFRITQSFRGVGYRDKNILKILSLHPDHDSAYQK